MDVQTLNESDGQTADSAKRRQIMEGARTVFLAAGFDGASMNDVARVSGVSKGTLYVYFDSKERLFETLVREERQQQAEQLAVFFSDHGDVRVELSNFGRRLMEMMTRPEQLAQVRTVIAAANRFPQLGRAFFEAGPCFGASSLSAYLRRQTELGVLKIEDYDRAAWQFLELIQSGILKSLLFRMTESVTPQAIAAAVEAGVNVFMAAYRARADARRDEALSPAESVAP